MNKKYKFPRLTYFIKITGICFIITSVSTVLIESHIMSIKNPFHEWLNPKDNSKMIWIPGGEFMMGSETENHLEKPRHLVKIKGFWLSKYEITNRQYMLFIKETNHCKPDFWDDPNLNHPDHPVVGITWRDAIAYCEWAGVRLPSEAEWEYVAACGSKQYNYGTATGEINHNLSNYSCVQGSDRWIYTSPVGSFPPNPFGIYDLAGNAWEWCSSSCKPYPYVKDDGREDTNKEKKELRVMKGGSWHYGSDYCRTSDRHYHCEHLRYDYVGFRVAISDTLINKDQ